MGPGLGCGFPRMAGTDRSRGPGVWRGPRGGPCAPTNLSKRVPHAQAQHRTSVRACGWSAPRTLEQVIEEWSPCHGQEEHHGGCNLRANNSLRGGSAARDSCAASAPPHAALSHTHSLSLALSRARSHSLPLARLRAQRPPPSRTPAVDAEVTHRPHSPISARAREPARHDEWAESSPRRGWFATWRSMAVTLTEPLGARCSAARGVGGTDHVVNPSTETTTAQLRLSFCMTGSSVTMRLYDFESTMSW